MRLHSSVSVIVRLPSLQMEPSGGAEAAVEYIQRRVPEFAGAVGSNGFGLGRCRGFGAGKGIDGPFTDDASCGVDFRNRISMRRRSGISPGVPDSARLSSMLTSCAPERGISL
jgi:hypothetical protein